MRRKLLTMVVCLLLVTSQSVSAQTYDFDFTNLNENVESISDYTDKPIVLDWAASWCGICEQNQETFSDIYDEYKSKVNFLTISYGGSGDTVEQVEEMKGSYPWKFGLDHEDVSSDYGVSNGYVWILNTDLSLERQWEYTVVPERQLVSVIDTVLNGGDVATDTTEQSGSPQDNANEEINSYGLENNPLFIGFLIVISVVFVVLVSKGGKDSEPVEKNTLDDAIERQKENWDWND